MDEPDDDIADRTTVWVPVIRASDLGKLETRRTLWFLAGEGNKKARQALRDGSESDG